MRVSADKLVLSPTDLAAFLGCRHRTGLDMAAARGALTRPHFDDPKLELLFARGDLHEAAYIDSLRTDDRSVVDLKGEMDSVKAARHTIEAMEAGADVIVQATFLEPEWHGRADVLERVPMPSRFGAWSYQVTDTKLARETRPGAILQLCLYSEMLTKIQDLAPEFFHVVTPDPVTPRESYRFEDYRAYFRLVRDQLLATAVQSADAVTAAYYPEPVDLCESCAWFSVCAAKRRQDDHLSLVAGISRVQRRELEAHDAGTLTALASLPLPIPFKPARGTTDGFGRVREQARVQLASRDLDVPVFEHLPVEPGFGLTRLPDPSPGDLFLDLEGDLFAREGGREYLFGVVSLDPDGTARYQAYWGVNDTDERRAFEAVMDLIAASQAVHEGMHVYHYAPYEPSAFKRLMGRYATHEAELDGLLRGERLVDLYGVVKQGLRVGADRYSIKNLEPLYGYVRGVDLRQAGRYIKAMEVALESSNTEALVPEVWAGVEAYNRDDCLSTFHLRNWLEERRAALEAEGTAVPRPQQAEEEAPAVVDERAARVEALRARLIGGLPAEAADRSAEQQSRWILAYLLDWHRREAKAGWWEYYRLRDLPDPELLDEAKAVAGLEFVDRVELVLSKRNKPTGSVVDRYRFPIQEFEISVGDKLELRDEKGFGEVQSVDRAERTIDVKKGPTQADNHPSSAFVHDQVRTQVMEDALYAIADRVASAGTLATVAGEPDRAGRDLLLAGAPRLVGGMFDGTDSSVAAAIRAVLALDESVLAIQGPPGSGKTYAGARMICALVRAGKKVGVTANSHKVIRNLLDAVAVAASKEGLTIALGHKRGDESDVGAGFVVEFDKNPEAVTALASGEVQVLGGTAWLWARSEFAQTVDVLFVDEAGQLALANAVAVSQAARSLVLLGDPRQLEQPTKGSHPDGVGVSALQHILGGAATIPANRGVFLPTTRRLAPPICGYTSEIFYEGKLSPMKGLENQVLVEAGGFSGSGLWLAAVEHDSNRNYSDEEAVVIERLVRQLTARGVKWTNARKEAAAVTGAEILVVSPYNAQVSRLAERLKPLGVEVGTVDKFQGREAPIVIYSMATSRPEDAPRGMEFLYSPNRFNVATSRALCAAILVASPRLFEPECRSPRQMKLANALCRFRELASSVSRG